ncbi:unnamed protein product [Heterobilharzia americana]|nr:unnamed protein product [Heterobilharzia americana]CAH8621687.1 unnamed protein product [Heterobilharzia americana]
MYSFVYLFLNEYSIQIGYCYATQILPETQSEYTRKENRVHLCGSDLIQHVKLVCGTRGLYTPFAPRRSWNRLSHLEGLLQRNKRFEDLCTLYKIYEPDTVVTQCCCIGCTQDYLEQFCNP